MKRDNPKLFVHLRVESTNDGEILLQPGAPVRSIVYNSPKTRVIFFCLFHIRFVYYFSSIDIIGKATSSS